MTLADAESGRKSFGALSAALLLDCLQNSKSLPQPVGLFFMEENKNAEFKMSLIFF